ncbi:MAG: transposase family protein [Ahniella sp.]|nr:transposase family protein [Ahniella sp.]
MKAFSPTLGCRVLAEVFNRRFGITRRMTVSKSHVADVLRRHRSEIVWLRRTIRHRIPRPMPRNKTWAMDLTTVTDEFGLQRLVFGIVDHGTRASIALCELADKRSLTILRVIVDSIRQFGSPRRIRVDNEACFTSRLMRVALAVLGIQLQRIDPHCPWQNGRVERFFGTFKAAICRIVVNGTDLPHRLIEFRAFYNHVRPHQHLGGQTPAEAWNGIARVHGEGERVELWSGFLSGWYFPMKE